MKTRLLKTGEGGFGRHKYGEWFGHTRRLCRDRAGVNIGCDTIPKHLPHSLHFLLRDYDIFPIANKSGKTIDGKYNLSNSFPKGRVTCIRINTLIDNIDNVFYAESCRVY